jgi:hypothetical protein
MMLQNSNMVSNLQRFDKVQYYPEPRYCTYDKLLHMYRYSEMASVQS